MDSRDSSPRSTRRTEGKRTHGRSARVMEAVMEATAEELGRVGFGSLRIEDVAARSGVNKTTIYRRWPTKTDLIAAVIAAEEVRVEDIDTGSLESDIRETLKQMRERLYSMRHRGIMRVLMGERAHPEVAQLVRETRDRHMAARERIFKRAIARGELAPCETTALVEFLTAPMVGRIMHAGMEVDDEYIESLTRVLTGGAKSLGEP